MKNLLSENMLRFGTKNLTPNQQRELVAKSIMETINQHGLANVIKKKLNEQPGAVPTTGVTGRQAAPGEQMKADGQGAKLDGMAMKIVGLLMKSIDVPGTNEQGILAALKMIEPNGGKDLYYKIVTYLQTKGIKGKKYKTVMNWIITDFTVPDTQSEDWTGSTKWLNQYQAILTKYNKNEVGSTSSSLFGM